MNSKFSFCLYSDMITKEELKQEVDLLPENMLEEVYVLLKKLTQQKRADQKLTSRNFNGQFDHTDIRKAAHE